VELASSQTTTSCETFSSGIPKKNMMVANKECSFLLKKQNIYIYIGKRQRVRAALAIWFGGAKITLVKTGS